MSISCSGTIFFTHVLKVIFPESTNINPPIYAPNSEKNLLDKPIENLPYFSTSNAYSPKSTIKMDDFQRPSLVSPKKYLEPSLPILDKTSFIFVKVNLLNTGLRRKEKIGRKLAPPLSSGKGIVTAFRAEDQNRFGAFSIHVLSKPIYGFRKVINISFPTWDPKTYNLFIP